MTDDPTARPDPLLPEKAPKASRTPREADPRELVQLLGFILAGAGLGVLIGPGAFLLALGAVLIFLANA